MMHGCQNSEFDMSGDGKILQAILDDHGITVKQLCLLTGYSDSQVYRWLSGDATIKSIAWRTLWQQTHDHRIILLITGIDQGVFVAVGKKACGLDQGVQHGMQQMIAARREQLAVETELLTILEDGKVDGKDRAAIARYEAAFPKMLGSQIALYEMILGSQEAGR